MAGARERASRGLALTSRATGLERPRLGPHHLPGRPPHPSCGVASGRGLSQSLGMTSPPPPPVAGVLDQPGPARPSPASLCRRGGERCCGVPGHSPLGASSAPAPVPESASAGLRVPTKFSPGGGPRAPAASPRSPGLLCAQPGKRPRSRETDAGRRVENLKVTSPRAHGGGDGAVDRPGPEAGLCVAASLGREAGGLENPERPDPRERGVWGARSAPRLRIPGIPGKSRTEPRAPADKGGRAPSRKTTALTPGAGARVPVLGGEGSGGGPNLDPPPAPRLPARKGEGSSLRGPIRARAVQSHHSSWGQGSGALRGGAGPDGGSPAPFPSGAPSRGQHSAPHLVAPAGQGMGSATLAGPNPKGLPGCVPARSPEAQTRVELGLQRNLDAEKQPRRRPELRAGVLRIGPWHPEGEKESELTFNRGTRKFRRAPPRPGKQVPKRSPSPIYLSIPSARPGQGQRAVARPRGQGLGESPGLRRSLYKTKAKFPKISREK